MTDVDQSRGSREGARVERGARLRAEVRKLASLSIPVAATQVSTMLMGIVDTAMLGRLSVEAIAAASLANVWNFATLLFANGIVFGIDPVVAQAHGARDGRTAAIALQRGVVLAFLLSIPVGVLAALATTRYRLRFGQAIQIYLLLPFTIPLVVSGLGMMVFFGEIRILGALWPVGVALCVINLPFMIWAVSAAIGGLDPELEYAAASCGAQPVQVFFTVTLPAIMPGVITGALLMFILAFNEFLVSLFLTDSRIVTLPVQIYNSIRAVITPDLAAVSVVYIIIALVAIWVLDRLVGLDIFLKSR